MNSICIVSKDQIENLDICIAYSTFGVANGSVALHAAKSINRGDELLIYLGGTGIVGIAAAKSEAILIEKNTPVPNWSFKSSKNGHPPWTYLIPWENYQKIDPPYNLKFNSVENEETGIKKGWLLQSMKAISDEQTEKIKKLIGV